jgi:hypothetical protein
MKICEDQTLSNGVVVMTPSLSLLWKDWEADFVGELLEALPAHSRVGV